MNCPRCDIILIPTHATGNRYECPRCNGRLEIHRGIEVGHVFKLGSKYSEAMGATYLNADGQEKPMIMGCYGIGVGRTAAAAIEQNNDANGIIWPVPLAPFQVVVTAVNPKDGEVLKAAEGLYTELVDRGVEVLLDDRDERPGVKFKDADLLGIPLRITVGARGLKEGKVEMKRRGDENHSEVNLAGAAGEAIDAIKEMRTASASAG